MKKRIGAIGTPPSSPEPSWLAHIWGKLRHFARADDGVSAIEFALLAPVLVPAFLLTVDVGFALTERMRIDQVLRAGAQSAAAGGDTVAIDQVMRAATKKSGTDGEDLSLALGVEPFEEPRGSTPQSFYRLTGKKTYLGIFFDYDLSSTLLVQVR